MIGLGFLLALVIYIVIALALAFWIPRALFDTPRARIIARIVVLLTFVLIPTWDIIPGKLYFDHLCRTEGGLKIYKTVEGVEGFYYFPGAEFRQEALDQYGYKYVEAGTAASFYRYSLKDGGLAKEKINQLSSKYGVQLLNTDLFWNITKYSEIIVNLQTKETLATKRQFYYPGNWVQQKVKPLLGGGRFCPLLPPDSPLNREFYVSTLKPNN